MENCNYTNDLSYQLSANIYYLPNIAMLDFLTNHKYRRQTNGSIRTADLLIALIVAIK